MTFQLRDYQEQAVTRMLGEPGFLLADDMGLGKTVTALEEVRRSGAAMILVVTQKSARSVWEEHIRLMFPGVEASEIEVKNKRGQDNFYLDALTTTDRTFVVTNYEQVGKPAYQRVTWDFIICDEAQSIKNRQAKRSKAIKKLRVSEGGHKRALTGTPIINQPAEVWSILNWLFPRRYTSYWRFFNANVVFDTHNRGECDTCHSWHNQEFRVVHGARNPTALKQELGQYTLRRLKRNHLKELPEKFYTNRLVDLNPKQRKIYNDMKAEALAWVGLFEDVPLPAPQAVAQLTRLRQITGATPETVEYNDEGGISVTLGEPSPKLDALMDIIASTDQKIVVFTNYAQMVRLAEARLQKARIGYTRIIGADGEQSRANAIEEFQQGDAQVFIATIGAGGVGITLTAASIAVFLDRSWSPAQNWQAEDRLHRMGQKRAVQIINVMAKDTVDETVEDKLKFKADMFRSILGG